MKKRKYRLGVETDKTHEGAAFQAFHPAIRALPNAYSTIKIWAIRKVHFKKNARRVETPVSGRDKRLAVLAAGGTFVVGCPEQVHHQGRV